MHAAAALYTFVFIASNHLFICLNSADESGATETVIRAIDEQENKFDDFIQNILKSSATSSAGEEGAAGDALRAQQSGPPTLSLAEKLSALSTVRFFLFVKRLVRDC